MHQISNEYALVGDIGGTNGRFGLVPIIRQGAMDNDIFHVRSFLCNDFKTITSLIRHYLAGADKFPPPKRGVIAVPCPVKDDQIRFTNIDWYFSKKAVQDEIGFSELTFINDFYAQAFTAYYIDNNDVEKIGNGTPAKDRPVAVIGPGSGLGVSLIIPDGDCLSVVNSEGGHTGFSPSDDTEIDIFKILTHKLGRLSNERLLSGPGLANLYTAIARIRGKKARDLAPDEITENAQRGQCEICRETLDRFCGILGTFAGDIALVSGALGGVYITGGIVPRFVEYIRTSEFRARFEKKGRFEHYLKEIPTYIVTLKNPGLYGAARVFMHHRQGR